MTITVLAGDWPAGIACAVTGTSIQMGALFGPTIGVSEIASVEVVTERDHASILGKIGWGFVGGLVGPLGALAGLIGGGQRHEKIMTLELIDGRRALLRCTEASYQGVLALGFKGREARRNAEWREQWRAVTATEEVISPPRARRLPTDPPRPALERPETTQSASDIAAPDILKNLVLPPARR
jgi:hypothetical protein